MEGYLHFPEMQTHRIEKFKLNMIKELCKFFTVEIAAKVELYLKIQVVLQSDLGEEVVEELRRAKQEL